MNPRQFEMTPITILLAYLIWQFLGHLLATKLFSTILLAYLLWQFWGHWLATKLFSIILLAYLLWQFWGHLLATKAQWFPNFFILLPNLHATLGVLPLAYNFVITYNIGFSLFQCFYLQFISMFFFSTLHAKNKKHSS